ncbi:hypothetical protein ACFQ4C_21505 [Larkinella insperata]|uniref:Uncharacterized protein n=1 Tax=Larkinella insperata TaxID=332158 RepID=A0ABW3QNL4_9BACT
MAWNRYVSSHYRTPLGVGSSLKPFAGQDDAHRQRPAVFNAIYTLRVNEWGFNADATGRLTATNANQYRFGNRLNSSLVGFYVQQWESASLALMPSAGFYGEVAHKDREYGKIVAETGGHLLAGTLGLDVHRESWMLGINAQLPVLQKISEGLVKDHSRLGIHLAKTF